MGDILLKAEHVTKRFGGICALEDASLELRKGEVLALIGANGAGKSTLIKIITGAYSNDEGTITLEGKELDVKSTYEARELGISAVYQEFSLINTLSVAENIYLGKMPKAKFGLIEKIKWKEINTEAQKILDTLGTDIKPETKVGNLSVAQKQMVEIAKALSNDIKVLIMDEPTASLADNDIENMFKVVKSLKEKGIGIIYVSHRLEELPVIADRVSVYRDGRYIKSLDIIDAPKAVIIENMVGEHIHTEQRKNVSTTDVILEVKDFSSGTKFKDINFNLHKGEVLGIAGLAGAGRTELVRSLFGADKKDSGEMYIEGQQVDIKSPLDAKRHGLGFITEDRKEEGLFLNMELHTNLGMTILKELKRGLKISLKHEEDLMREYITSLKIKCHNEHQKAKNLSGGNQQKVVIAKWLATKPRILIMDEPTRGIDIGAKNQIYDLISTLAEQGIGIIVISSELPELLQVSDRIITLAEGRKTGDMPNIDLTQEILLDYATRKL
ncbi:hypothetical protein AN639_02835 [Candidatus Epulonipiscium fishelsonii]|uniref:Uncharacterized protein n=1 Tax=Candidatus Epulonipiscium fishelsonii TaxID=77094 RepID=A0ACC8XD36_9FIRM|nr:hypothetical protein AN396_05525 [Epulopiscium sp. SCG-B11WGA-EpuloA1]ONI41767.1 hypothetical protein AN639_02835 [Epulopiscium sp. SCG-B05WGA-EpuloA1]